MGLERYRDKRDFQRTPEPEGAGDAGREEWSFVVQRHDASRLHYDFRLELDGVLVSWAVPKGPSLDPSDRRLAIHVEDHPVDYGGFEGVIPKDEYGGGTVMLWDRGSWRPRDDPREGLEQGSLTFELGGERLHGSWKLFRIDDDEDQWLLVKRKDDAADPDVDIEEVWDTSVSTGRTTAEIAEAGKRVWAPGEGEHTAGGGEVPDPSDVEGAERGDLPERPEPQLATSYDQAPRGEEWLHEVKYDGYRILARKAGDDVRLLTRAGKDWTDRLEPLVEAARALPVERALLDGEAVILRKDGTTDFGALQDALATGRLGRLRFVAFDLLHLEGWDLREAALEDRKALLEALLAAAPGEAGRFRYVKHVVGRGEEVYRHACRMALEGAMSKRRDAPYRPGRTRTWRKLKCRLREELVVVGWTPMKGGRAGLGALLVGAWDDGALRYAGRVGTGFTERQREVLRERLEPLERDDPPVEDPPKSGRDGVTWVDPELVVEVELAEWTRDGKVRQASFQGVREDKPAREVTTPEPGGVEPPPISEAAREAIRRTRWTSPERVLWPDQGVTKAILAGHYAQVAERILPEIAERPLSLLRCPHGREKSCFWQKHHDPSFPDSVRPLETEDDKPFLYVDSLEGLMALVQLGALELHPWGARIDRPDRPDRLVIDLDPGPDVAWGHVLRGARDVRRLLEEAGLESFPRLTGGKGLHVVVPLVRRVGWDTAKAFCRGVARHLEEAAPDRYTASVSKKKREGRIYVDYLRNTRGATAIASWSTRARPGAPVAVPVAWEELDGLRAGDQFTVENLPRRLAAVTGDPWEGAGDLRQSITRHALATVGVKAG